MWKEIILAVVVGACPGPGCAEPTTVVVSNRLVGKSVLCYYENVGSVVTKEYLAVRVRISGRTGLVNVPVVNGHLPAIRWTLDSNGMISSMICNYQEKIKYSGEEVSYGEGQTKEPVKTKANLPCTPSSEPIQVSKVRPAPVPSKTTRDIPSGGDFPE